MKTRTPEEMREYQRQRRANLVTPTNVTPGVVTPTGDPLDVPGAITKRYNEWTAARKKYGVLTPDIWPHMADPNPPNCEHGKRYCRPCGTLVDSYPPATAQQWTNAYNTIQAAKDRASTADKQAARQAAAQQD